MYIFEVFQSSQTYKLENKNNSAIQDYNLN